MNGEGEIDLRKEAGGQNRNPGIAAARGETREVVTHQKTGISNPTSFTLTLLLPLETNKSFTLGLKKMFFCPSSRPDSKANIFIAVKSQK